MKRLAAIAVVVAMSALPACAQHGGGSHGGFSGSHSGGFSGGHAGFSAPSFHGGSGAFVRSGPPRSGGGPGGQRFFGAQPPSVRPPYRFGGAAPGQFVRPPQYVSSRIPYPGRGVRPVAPIPSAPRQVSSGTSHRMPYRSPYNGDHHGGGWDHGHDHDGGHHHVTFYGYYGWAGFPYVYGWAGYPYWPWWGLSYNILPASWDYQNDYDSQPGSNYTEPYPPYPEYNPAPYDKPASGQPEPQQPYSSPAPPASQPAPAIPAPPEAAITLVFKDGRPNEQIHNYLLTATTLSVLDEQRREIPVAQIDLAATAQVNRAAGVEFALPSHR